MSFEAELRELWLSVRDVSTAVAELRDKYVEFPGMHPRFSDLYEVWQNLLQIEQSIFEFLELKKPAFGSKPSREFLMIAQAAISNSKILLKIADAEHRALLAKD